MTFTEIVTEISERLNLTSSTATARIGRLVNAHYKKVTSSIGLKTARPTIGLTAVASIGSAVVTFSGIEKIDRLLDLTSGSVVELTEISIDEMRAKDPGDGDPTEYAVQSMGKSTVVIRMNVLAQTAFTLTADGLETAATLSGSTPPAFSESFHDVLVEGVLKDEYLKLEKPGLAKIAEAAYKQRMSELRLFIASGKMSVRQGQSVSGSAGSSAGGGGNSGGQSYTQTGLITFDRDPSAPFAVSASSAVVPNLDADLLDGLDSLAFARIASSATVTGEWTFDRDPNAPFAVAASSAVVPNLDADKVDGVHVGTMAADRIVYGSSATALAASADLRFDGTSLIAASAVNTFRFGLYNNLTAVSATAAAKIVPSIAGQALVMATNAYWDDAAATWKSIAGGQVTALVMESGSVWICYVTTVPAGADTTINANGGGDPAWKIGTKFYSTPTGNVGIGDNFDAGASGEPEAKLHTSADGNINIIHECFEGSAAANTFIFRKARGTHATPADVADGDALGSISMYARSSTTWFSTASIGSAVDGTFTTGQRPPSNLEFSTNIANSSAAVRLRISGAGLITVVGSLAIGATPATVGALRLANEANIVFRNAANNDDLQLIASNSSNQLQLGQGGVDIKWGIALIALGGGSAPTLGTIGGSGPATAGQNSWMRVIDSTGAAFWVPVWK